LEAKLLIAQLIFRFAVGGLIVSLFAALGDVLKPKSFAGLFGLRLRSRSPLSD
jgi:hypothetical protein